MATKQGEIRCRMAPSPTGPLHFGTARTTLVNWLFARHNHGTFVLRMEDTDKARSTSESEKEIIAGLRWLGIEWDEGPDIGGPFAPYRQSERGDTYEPYLKKLLDGGHAYYCYCTKEELEEEKKLQIAKGVAPKYSGHCRISPPTGREPQVIRFKMPEKIVTFKDIIHGEISFDLKLAGDLVIARNIREPLYNFAVVIDDYEMKITHVIRGDDHIVNTPKQIAFGEALGFPILEFAHMPQILNPDRSKMSKRFAETSLIDYREVGYLSEALINFIALLGWHPKDDNEILSKSDLVKQFTLERMQKAGAIFDEMKLKWLNSQYIKKLDTDSLKQLLEPLLEKQNISADDAQIKKIIGLEKGRAETLEDIINDASFFFKLRDFDTSMLIWKKGTAETAKKALAVAWDLLEAIPKEEFVESSLQTKLMPLAETLGRGDLLWPLRVALSGKEASPGPFEIMSILGKEESLLRIKQAEAKL